MWAEMFILDRPALNPNLPTPSEIAEAKAQTLAERELLRAAGVSIAEDEIELGMRLGNAMSAALYGVRGEKR